MRFDEFNEGLDKTHKAAIKGMHQLSGDQYYGLYKTMNDVAGHDGKKQTAPNGNSDDEVSDKPFAYAYTDEEEAMIKAADPKAKKITSSKSEEVKEGQLDEIDRRGFLKGLGAAAVGAGAGIAGYKHLNPPPRPPQEIITDAIKSGKWSLKAYRDARNEGYSDEEIADYLTDYKGQVYTKFKQDEPPAPTTVIPKESDEQGVAEAGQWNKMDSYERDYAHSVAGFGKNSFAYRQDGGANDEGWDREEYRAPTRKIYSLEINGKIWQKDGNTVTFFTQNRAESAKKSILNKRPEAKIRVMVQDV